MNASASDDFIAADMDGNGQDDIIGNFGSTLGGIFVRHNQGGWSKLHNSSPEMLVAGNLDPAVLPTLTINDRTVSENAGYSRFHRQSLIAQHGHGNSRCFEHRG